MSLKKSWLSDKVTSSDGYYVRPVGRSAILYSDQTGKVYVSAEALVGQKEIAWALYPADMRVGSVSGKKLQGEQRRSLITDRIKAVFAHLKWRLEIA